MKLPDRVEYWLFAIGYSTKAIVYLLMSGFAIATVAGVAYGANGPQEVMEWLRYTYFGDILLFLFGTGLGIYAFYKIYSAFTDSRNEGTGANAIGNRFGWALNGCVYATLSFTAYNLMLDGHSGEDPRKDIIGLVLTYEWGQTAILLSAITVAIVGIFQTWIAFEGQHMKFIETCRFSSKRTRMYSNLGKVGIVATSVIYLIMAYFLYRASRIENGNEFKGVGESLAMLERSDISTWLLLIMGLGLLAYSLFMLIMARHGRA